jgi:cobalt-zinc-cadmium efflux system outer membrane protein
MSMFNRPVLWSLVLLVHFVSGQTAGHTQESTLSLDSFSSSSPVPLKTVVQYAREHNPAIQTARERWRAAQYVSAQAGVYDDPVITWDSWNAPENLRFDNADNNIVKVSQKIPFPGKLRLKSAIAEKTAHQQQAEWRTTMLDVEAQVKKAYYDLWGAQQNLQIYTRDQDLAAQAAAIAAQKYAVGQVAQVDVLRSQLEQTTLSTRLAAASIAFNEARARLNLLLDRTPDTPLGAPQAPPPVTAIPSFQTIAALLDDTQPELAAPLSAIERANLALSLAQRAYYPDFEVSLGRFTNFGRRDGFGVTVSATIPLAFRQKYDAGVEEAAATLRAAQQDFSRQKNVILLALTQALAAAELAHTQLSTLLSTHLPQAEQTTAAALIGYQTGGSDFSSLLDSLRAVEQAHLEHITAAVNLEKAWADLERAVGRPVPRRGQ